MKTIYLAAPFWHDKPNVRWARAEEASHVAVKLMISEQAAVFSPLSHGFHMHQYLPEPQRHDHDFWLQRDLAFLSNFDSLFLLPLPGWRESRGVTRELAFAKNHDLSLVLIQDFKGKYDILTKDESDRLGVSRSILMES